MAKDKLIIHGKVQKVEHGGNGVGSDSGEEYYRFQVLDRTTGKVLDCEIKAAEIQGRIVESDEVKVYGKMSETGQVIAQRVVDVTAGGAVIKPKLNNCLRIVILIIVVILVVVALIFFASNFF